MERAISPIRRMLAGIISISLLIGLAACYPAADPPLSEQGKKSVSLTTTFTVTSDPYPAYPTPTNSPYFAPPTDFPYPIPTSPAYVPPPTQTFAPIPPTATPVVPRVIVNTAGGVISGTGDFPALEIIAPSLSDGSTPAIYRVEKNHATEWLTYQGANRDDTVTFQMSPDTQHAAILMPDLVTLRVLSADSTLTDIYTAKGNLNPTEKGSASETISSIVWIDNGHLLYDRFYSPSSAENLDAAKEGQIPAFKSEVWSSSLDGKDQKLIASGPFYRVLGVALDQKHLYVTRVIEGSWMIQGFSLIDLDSGKMTNLWPSEEKAKPNYYDLHLITVQDGSPRVLYTFIEQGPGTTNAQKMPTVYLGDPETGKSVVIWNGINNGKVQSPDNQTTYYLSPRDILWAPDGSNRFIYQLGNELWQSDLSSGKEKKLGDADGDLIVWSEVGIITRNRNTNLVKIMDDQGNTTGQIQFPPGH